MKLFARNGANEQVAIDILRPLSVMDEGNRYVLVKSDSFIKLSRAADTLDDTTDTILNGDIDHWITAFGVMKRLLSVIKANRTSPFCTKGMDIFRMDTRRVCDYHPQDNGQVERLNSTIVRMLQCYVVKHTNTWDRLLAVLTLAHNARPHRNTNSAPLDWVMPLGEGNLTLPRGKCTWYDDRKRRAS